MYYFITLHGRRMSRDVVVLSELKNKVLVCCRSRNGRSFGKVSHKPGRRWRGTALLHTSTSVGDGNNTGRWRNSSEMCATSSFGMGHFIVECKVDE